MLRTPGEAGGCLSTKHHEDLREPLGGDGQRRRGGEGGKGLQAGKEGTSPASSRGARTPGRVWSC